MSYELDIKNYSSHSLHYPNNISFVIKDILTDKEADDLISLYELAEVEIKPPINKINKYNLTNDLHARDKSLRFFLMYDVNKIIAFGFSHNDYYKGKTIFYINTIYILEKERGKGFGELILHKIIQYNLIEFKEIISFTGVVHPQNIGAIKLLSKVGFTKKQN